MWWLYPLVGLLCVVVWLCLRWHRVRSYWQVRGVPHRAPSPLLGSLTFLLKQNPSLWLKDMYQEMPSPYIGIWFFWKPALVINDPALCRLITIKDADNFRNRHASSGKSDPIGALNLFAVNDPMWSELRRRLSPLFTSAKLKASEQITLTKSNNLIQRMRNEIKMGNHIDLRTVMSDYTTDVIGESAYGVRSDSVLTGNSAMREITKDFMKFSVWRGLAWCSIFFLPELVDIFKFSFFSKTANKWMSDVFKAMVAQRGGYDKPVTEARDLLDLLLKFKQDAAKDNVDISEDILIAQAAIFLQGGFDTSSVAVTYCIYELAYNPDMQDRLHQEVDETQRKFEGKEVSATILGEMPFLNAVLKEVMRLYPAMAWLDREAIADYKITDELTIPAGMPVLINTIGMHYDPQYFPDPEKFCPDRFLSENEANIVPYTYLPFGEGPRACIGRRFGFQTARRALYEITRNFKWSPLPGYPKPSEAEVEKRGFFFMPGEKLSVDFMPREG